MEHRIGTLNEHSLHAELKQHLFQPGDEMEVKVDGYYIDLKRGETLIEVQTGNFAHLRRKLSALLQTHPVLLYYPIARRKWITRVDSEGSFLKRRKSPRQGSAFDLFDELLNLRAVALHPNLEVHLLLVELEEVWRDDGKGSWRKKFWSIADQRLLAVEGQTILRSAADYLALLPPDLPQPFTSAELAKHARCTRRLAGKAIYALREMGLLAAAGSRKRFRMYEAVPQALPVGAQKS